MRSHSLKQSIVFVAVAGLLFSLVKHGPDWDSFRRLSGGLKVQTSKTTDFRLPADDEEVADSRVAAKRDRDLRSSIGSLNNQGLGPPSKVCPGGPPCGNPLGKKRNSRGHKNLFDSKRKLSGETTNKPEEVLAAAKEADDIWDRDLWSSIGSKYSQSTSKKSKSHSYSSGKKSKGKSTSRASSWRAPSRTTTTSDSSSDDTSVKRSEKLDSKVGGRNLQSLAVADDLINSPIHPLKTSECPCSSSESLDTFLDQQNAWNKFSKSNPVCPSAAYNHIHVTIPFYNLAQDVLDNTVSSALEQDYQGDRLTLWLYDDASDDPSTIASTCSNAVYEFNPPTNTGNSWVHMQELANTMSNGHGRSDLLCVQSTRHLGPGGSKYYLFGLVKSMAGPNDVVLVIDGDDTLHRKDALKIVNQKYLDTSAFFTYGSYKGRWEEQTKDLPSGVRGGEIEFKPREQTWVYGHPRTFKVHLLDHITERDFQHSDGTWLVKATERGFVYRMLELAGPSRIGYIADKIYNYKYSATSSTLVTVLAEVRTAQLAHVQSLESSQPLAQDVDVVLLAWKRVYLLTSQLIWLQKQVDLGKRQIHVHVVNNNWMESHAVEQAVNKFREWQISSKEMQDLLSQEKNGILSLKVSLIHFKQAHHCFARFVYVAELRRTKPLDQVIFLDDDQYFPTNLLSTFLQAYKPKSMTTWYGKTFHESASSGGLAQYWKPDAGLTDVINGNVTSDKFKYGGPGGSIFDTDLWLLDSQLLRLARDLSAFAKMDDLWASYVLDGLLGWDITRLSPDVLPVDIGAFNQKKLYYDVIKKKIDSAIEDELLSLNGRRIFSVSTYNNPAVDKQSMFESLQTTFRWDVE